MPTSLKRVYKDQVSAQRKKNKRTSKLEPSDNTSSGPKRDSDDDEMTNTRSAWEGEGRGEEEEEAQCFLFFCFVLKGWF